MPTCKHCETTWTYIDSLKNMFRYKCPYCGEKNYVRALRVRDILMNISILVIVLLIFPMFELSFGTKMATGFLWVAIYLATYPINLQLSKEEEPFF